MLNEVREGHFSEIIFGNASTLSAKIESLGAIIVSGVAVQRWARVKNPSSVESFP